MKGAEGKSIPKALADSRTGLGSRKEPREGECELSEDAASVQRCARRQEPPLGHTGLGAGPVVEQ